MWKTGIVFFFFVIFVKIIIHLQVSGQKALLNHKKSHKKWVCVNCNSEISMNSRTSHIKKCHNMEEIKCEFCSYVTNNLGNLKRHQETHVRRMKEEEFYSCNECRKDFNSMAPQLNIF